METCTTPGCGRTWRGLGPLICQHTDCSLRDIANAKFPRHGSTSISPQAAPQQPAAPQGSVPELGFRIYDLETGQRVIPEFVRDFDEASTLNTEPEVPGAGRGLPFKIFVEGRQVCPQILRIWPSSCELYDPDGQRVLDLSEPENPAEVSGTQQDIEEKTARGQAGGYKRKFSGPPFGERVKSRKYTLRFGASGSSPERKFVRRYVVTLKHEQKQNEICSEYRKKHARAQSEQQSCIDKIFEEIYKAKKVPLGAQGAKTQVSREGKEITRASTYQQMHSEIYATEKMLDSGQWKMVRGSIVWSDDRTHVRRSDYNTPVPHCAFCTVLLAVLGLPHTIPTLNSFSLMQRLAYPLPERLRRDPFLLGRILSGNAGPCVEYLKRALNQHVVGGGEWILAVGKLYYDDHGTTVPTPKKRIVSWAEIDEAVISLLWKGIFQLIIKHITRRQQRST